MMLMHPLRRAAIIILSPLLPLLLFATALDWGIVRTVGNPKNVKQIVAESGVYDGVVPGLLDQIKHLDTSAGNIPVSDSAVRQAANQALSPQAVQKNAEGAIDGIYSWLNGKTAQPDFKIDLSAVQTNFANNLAKAMEVKAAGLPTCTTPYTATAFDIYNATCLPRGLSPATVADQIRSGVDGGQGFIDKSVITSNDIKGNGNQSAFSDQWKGLPKQFQRAKKTPFILILLTVLTAASLVLLNLNRWRGLRHVGLTLIVIGVFMMFFAWSLNRTNTSLVQPKITLSNTVMQADIRKLVTDIVQRVDKNYWVFGSVYAALGVIAVFARPLATRTGLVPAAETPVETEPEQPPRKRGK